MNPCEGCQTIIHTQSKDWVRETKKQTVEAEESGREIVKNCIPLILKNVLITYKLRLVIFWQLLKRLIEDSTSSYFMFKIHI